MKPTRKYALRDGQTFTVYVPDARLHSYVVAFARKRGISRNRAVVEIIAEHRAANTAPKP